MDKRSQFIKANTTTLSWEELTNEHVIPVHLKDNEPFISSAEFIQIAKEVAQDVLGSTSSVQIRASHPIKGRIPEAKHKASSDLLPHESTLYYERLAWTCTIPEVKREFGGEVLELTIGGVKPYNLDNAYNLKGAVEHFKFFVGFRNSVCTNLCISTDGLLSDMKVRSHRELELLIRNLLVSYDIQANLSSLTNLQAQSLTESQFAYLLGRIKMYNAMPGKVQKYITGMGVSDSQLNTVASEYFSDKVHGRENDGSINLWRLYNLFTSSNKSSYVDTFLDRNASILSGVLSLQKALDSGSPSFYLVN